MPYDNTTPIQDCDIGNASTTIALEIDKLIEIIGDLDTQLFDAHERTDELDTQLSEALERIEELDTELSEANKRIEELEND